MRLPDPGPQLPGSSSKAGSSAAMGRLWLGGSYSLDELDTRLAPHLTG
jgi:hypothetical protein